MLCVVGGVFCPFVCWCVWIECGVVVVWVVGGGRMDVCMPGFLCGWCLIAYLLL